MYLHMIILAERHMYTILTCNVIVSKTY